MTTSTLDRVLSGYLICALWSSMDHQSSEPFDSHSPFDIHPTSLEKARAICTSFLKTISEIYPNISQEDSKLGHDLWLTQNRHGAGFWDGDYSDHGDALTKAAHDLGEVDCYEGDDGLIHFS